MHPCSRAGSQAGSSRPLPAASPLSKLASSGTFVARNGGRGDLGCAFVVSGGTAAVTASGADPAPCAGTLCLMWATRWVRDPIRLKTNLGTWWEMAVLKPDQLPDPGQLHNQANGCYGHGTRQNVWSDHAAVLGGRTSSGKLLERLSLCIQEAARLMSSWEGTGRVTDWQKEHYTSDSLRMYGKRGWQKTALDVPAAS